MLTFPLQASESDSHKEMLTSVGFGERKVSETAEMLLKHAKLWEAIWNLQGYLPYTLSKVQKGLTCLTFPKFRSLRSHQSPPSLTFPCGNQRKTPTEEMFNLVGFGEQKVSETAKMLTC